MNSKQVKTMRDGLDKIHAKLSEYNGLCVSFDLCNGFQDTHKKMLVRCLGEADSCLLDVLTPLHTIQNDIAQWKSELKSEAENVNGDMQKPGLHTGKQSRVGGVAEMRGLLGRMNALELTGGACRVRPYLGMRQEIVDLWRQAEASGYTLAHVWVLKGDDPRRVCDGLQQMIDFFVVNPTCRDDTALLPLFFEVLK